VVVVCEGQVLPLARRSTQFSDHPETDTEPMCTARHRIRQAQAMGYTSGALHC